MIPLWKWVAVNFLTWILASKILVIKTEYLKLVIINTYRNCTYCNYSANKNFFELWRQTTRPVANDARFTAIFFFSIFFKLLNCWTKTNYSVIWNLSTLYHFGKIEKNKQWYIIDWNCCSYCFADILPRNYWCFKDEK